MADPAQVVKRRFKLPWGIVLAITIIVVAGVWFGLLKPTLTKRQWVPPTPSQLVWVSGVFSHRINTKSPYVFAINGGETINLYCRSYIFTFNDCLAQRGFDVNGGGRNVRLAYFVFDDAGGYKAVIMDAEVDGRTIISYRDQMRDLQVVEKIEDEYKEFPWVTYVEISLIALFGGGMLLSRLADDRVDDSGRRKRR